MVRILLVERDDFVREARRFALADAGYDVVEAADAQLAVRLLQASRQAMVAVVALSAQDTADPDALAAIAADSRLARRHAFVVVAPATRAISGALWHTLTSLEAYVLQCPVSDAALLHAVTLAASRTRAVVQSRGPGGRRAAASRGAQHPAPAFTWNHSRS
jgi:CheY-like chemotaxis protein